MPIKDLQRRVPMLKRGGIIRLGYKKSKTVNVKRGGKTVQKTIEYPVAADHFVLKDAPHLIPIYGEQPTRLNVLLPFDEIDRVFHAWHQCWQAGGLLCRGDGEAVHYTVAPDNGEVLVRDGLALCDFQDDGHAFEAGDVVPCSGLEHDLYTRCEGCRPSGLLIVLIREIPRLVYYQISTTSKHNIVKLTGQMEFLRRRCGRLVGIPLILELRPREISTPSGEGGKRVRRTKYLLSLEADPEWVEALLEKQQREALPGAEEEEPERRPVLGYAEDETIPEGHAGERPMAMEPPVWEEPVQQEQEEKTDQEPVQAAQEEDSGTEEDKETQPETDANETDVQRPADAPTVRRWLRKRAKWVKGESDDWSKARRPPDIDQKSPGLTDIQRVTELIGAAVKEEGDTDERVERKVEGVLTYIYERRDPSLLTAAEAGTLLAWLEGGQNAQEPNEVAVQECRALLHEALPDRVPGQVGLPLEEEGR